MARAALAAWAGARWQEAPRNRLASSVHCDSGGSGIGGSGRGSRKRQASTNTGPGRRHWNNAGVFSSMGFSYTTAPPPLPPLPSLHPLPQPLHPLRLPRQFKWIQRIHWIHSRLSLWTWWPVVCPPSDPSPLS
jgi:hypothetical protein